MPLTRVHSGDQMPPPRGHFTGTKMTERRRKRLQLSNKIFINIKKLRNTVSVFTTNKKLVQSGGNRCYKVTECSKRSIKKTPSIEITTSWPFHWYASSLTLLTNILAVGQSSWPELFILFYFMLLYWIAGIGIVFHCIKHNNKIHSYIQSLNPVLIILKFKYFKYSTKLV